jgi:hypothetical protein
MPVNEDRLATAERHLRDGEVAVARLERIHAEMMRVGHPETERVARTLLAPFRDGVARMRGHVEGLSGERRPLDPV